MGVSIVVFPQASQLLSEHLAIVGNNRWGEAALLLAIQYPKISTIIALVSSAYVVGGAFDNTRKA